MLSLIISNFGSFVGKKSERMVIYQGEEVIEEVPFFRLSEIVIAKSGISVSSDFLHEAVSRGIHLSFLDSSGKPYAMISSPYLTATVVTRRAQIESFSDERGVIFAKTIASGKIRNQMNLLKCFSKYLKSSDSANTFSQLEEINKRINNLVRKIGKIQGTKVDEIRESLLGLEGNVGREYWEGIRLILKKSKMEKRVHKGAQDPINSLLNYGYGILYSKIWGALLNAGLEPFAGFIHVDRPGKPSLVLDFIEEFRQPIVDRTVIALVNKGSSVEMEDNLLSNKTRNLLAERILQRLESEVEFDGKKHKLKSIIQMQARNLAMFFRGERKYKCYRFGW